MYIIYIYIIFRHTHIVVVGYGHVEQIRHWLDQKKGVDLGVDAWLVYIPSGNQSWQFKKNLLFHGKIIHKQFPNAPCMEYLPTFTPKMAQM